jgi:hypothetical protein
MLNRGTSLFLHTTVLDGRGSKCLTAFGTVRPRPNSIRSNHPNQRLHPMISKYSIACSKTSSRCPLRRKTHLRPLSLPRQTRPTRNHGTTLSAGSSRRKPPPPLCDEFNTDDASLCLVNRRANSMIHARRLRKRATDVCSGMEVIRTCAEIISSTSSGPGYKGSAD